MGNAIQKRGRKFLRKFSRVSYKAREEGKEHIRENLLQRFSHIQDIRLLILEWSLLVGALIMLAITQTIWFGETYADDVFVDGGTYTEATVGQVNSLNPLFATTNSEKVLSKLMFATLTTVDYSGHVGMGLAESLTPDENGRIWSLKLRDGLKWSDGEPLTNEDIMFTIGLIQNSAVNTVYGANLAGVKVREDESGRIIFTLPSAYADFASALEIPIVPKHELEDTEPKTLVEDDFSNLPVASGAFMFNAMQQAGASTGTVVYLSANPNHYAGKPMLNSFAVRAYDALEEIVTAVNSGVVTATAELSGNEVNKLKTPAYNRRDSSIDSGVFAFFNTAAGRLRDKRLREAIRQGIDLAEIRAAAPGTMKLDYPLIDSQILLQNYPTIPAHNYEVARTAISEISASETIVLNIATVKSGYLPEVANKFKEQLATLGIEANVTEYEETQDFVANIIARRNYDILIYEIELGAEPDLLPYYHSSQASTAGLNLASYRNALVDDLLIGARETLDVPLRAKKYETFLEYWVADVPAIALYQSNMIYVYNKNVRAYNENTKLVTPLDRFSDIINFASAKNTRYKTP